MEEYRRLAATRSDVLFGGRLANYAYYDMDDTVAAALELARRELRFA
jgi:UDP-galactopyranose mutase